MKQANRDFRKLDVWKQAHALTLAIYHATAKFPNDQKFSTVSQMQRAAVSIPANIAEGCGRGGTKELVRFLKIARGSASELEYFIQLTHELQYTAKPEATDLFRQTQAVGKMLTGYIKYLET